LAVISALPDPRLLANGIRRAIKAASYGPIPAGELTVSIGVAAYQAGERAEDLVRRAQEAAQQAKARGRNRVVLG